MKTAIVYDECGSDWAIECSDDTTVEELKDRYPEIQFRYWEQYTAREMAECGSVTRRRGILGLLIPPACSPRGGGC